MTDSTPSLDRESVLPPSLGETVSPGTGKFPEKPRVTTSLQTIFQERGLEPRKILEQCGIDEPDMMEANLRLVESTEMQANSLELSGVPVAIYFPEGKNIPQSVTEQYQQVLEAAKIADVAEYQRIKTKGLKLVLLPSSGFNRPWISGNTIFNQMPEGNDARVTAKNAHEFAHLILYETDGGVGKTPSSEVSEGAAIYLTDRTYRTSIVDAKLRLTDISVEDAIWLNSHKVKAAVESLKAKGIDQVASSASSMVKLAKENDIPLGFDPNYVYGAALMATLQDYCKELELPERENIKRVYAQSAKESTVEQSKKLPELALNGFGLSDDGETRVIVQTLMNTFSISPEEAAGLIKKSVGKITAG